MTPAETRLELKRAMSEASYLAAWIEDHVGFSEAMAASQEARDEALRAHP